MLNEKEWGGDIELRLMAIGLKRNIQKGGGGCISHY